ncbi:MAG: hypothetical protein ABH887_00655 [bacterium]
MDRICFTLEQEILFERLTKKRHKLNEFDKLNRNTPIEQKLRRLLLNNIRRIEKLLLDSGFNLIYVQSRWQSRLNN